MLAELAKDGIEPIWQYRYPFGISFAYLNTDKIGGVILELIEDKNRPSGEG